MATVEATSSQLSVVTRMAAQFPALRIVIDHFGFVGAEIEVGGRDAMAAAVAREEGDLLAG